MNSLEVLPDKLIIEIKDFTNIHMDNFAELIIRIAKHTKFKIKKLELEQRN